MEETSAWSNREEGPVDLNTLPDLLVKSKNDTR